MKPAIAAIKRRARARATYANTLATVLLVAVLAGSAYAALAKNSVGSRQLKPGAVKGSDIAAGAVGGSKITEGSLGGADFASGARPQHLRIDAQVAAAAEPSPAVVNLASARGLTLSLLCRTSVDSVVAELRATGPAGGRLTIHEISDPEGQPVGTAARGYDLSAAPSTVSTLLVTGNFVLAFVNGVYTGPDTGSVKFSVNLVATTVPGEICQARGTATAIG